MLASAFMNFYPKKRRKPGPSKNDEKVQRARQAEAQTRAAGTLATRLPGLSALEVRLTFKAANGVILAEDGLTLAAGDSFQLDADCPGACGVGRFDFAPALAEAISRGQDSGAVELACREPLYGGGGAPCACAARAEFSVRRA